MVNFTYCIALQIIRDELSHGQGRIQDFFQGVARRQPLQCSGVGEWGHATPLNPPLLIWFICMYTFLCKHFFKVPQYPGKIKLKKNDSTTAFSYDFSCCVNNMGWAQGSIIPPTKTLAEFHKIRKLRQIGNSVKYGMPLYTEFHGILRNSLT